ncbi:carbon catabolite repressor protein 4 homolog 5 isoform X2 [Tripterygium wilfordii]|nr:carbon catabolite repressor protein 4 homolog 5 isoform X2 [Tripterygium wilfordii]
MREETGHRVSSPEPSGAASKRKHHSEVRPQSRSQSKKQKLGFGAQTQTLKRHSYPKPPASNRFASIAASSRSRNKRSRRNSFNSDCYRKWTFASHDFSEFKDKVVVVSYNILGVENASNHPDLYSRVPWKFLKWDRRKELICKEIKSYNASILCFQEVDRFDDLDDRLRNDGFRGIYKARTGEANDGCAIFWTDKRFSLLHQENIEFRSYGLRDNVAQLCVLKVNRNQTESESCKEGSKTTPTKSRSLLVGNIHVLFNPNRGDIKLGQVRLFLERAYKLSQEWGGIPVIIAGDLNSIPQSALYQFLASSELDIRLHERRKISGQLDHSIRCEDLRYRNENVASTWMSISRPLTYTWSDEEIKLAAGSGGVADLRHQLNLHSAYLRVPGSCRTRDNYGEPLATSYHSKFMGTVDYI